MSSRCCSLQVLATQLLFLQLGPALPSLFWEGYPEPIGRCSLEPNTSRVRPKREKKGKGDFAERGLPASRGPSQSARGGKPGSQGGRRWRARAGAGAPRSPSSCAVPPSLSILGALPLNYESSEGLSPLKDLQAYQAGAGRPAPGHHANARCSASRGFCLPLQVTNAYRALAMGRAPGWRLVGQESENQT